MHTWYGRRGAKLQAFFLNVSHGRSQTLVTVLPDISRLYPLGQGHFRRHFSINTVRRDRGYVICVRYMLIGI